jgi:hypothetical protein
VAVVVVNHVAKDASMAACVWQAASVLLVAQVNTTGGAGSTVKVAVHVVVVGAHELVYVHVTEVLPPHLSGATGVVGDFVNNPLQPPVAVVVNNHAANDASIAACVWHAASVLFVAHVNTTGGDGSTVNVAVQVVVVGAHELVYVHVTVVTPPHLSGGIGVVGDVVNDPLQPPLAVVVNNHAANDASIAACVWHAASVLLVAHVNTTGGDGSTVNVAVQLVVVGAHELVYVHVTVVLPPHLSGAIGVVGDVVNIPLQPPLAVVVNNHAAKDASIAACVWQATSVLLVAQVNTTGGDGSTVNVAVQLVVVGAHELV